MTSTPGADGFHHPASEDELVALVQDAYRTGRQLRVRGATHSLSHAIYADPLEGFPQRVQQQTPPQGDGIEVMLDLYRGLRIVDEERKLVEVDAGIHLADDPSDPTGTATLETSLLWQLWKKGWALSDLGGVTHQTASGFTATGSSGGSLQFSINDNLYGFRVIDGRGEIHEFTLDDEDPDLFYAMSPNVGLLGVVSTVTLQCVDDYNISGQEAITSVDTCAIDLIGPGSEGRPSLEHFLRDAEYARVEWWPQRGVERVLVWQCQRMRPQLGFRPDTYQEFAEHPETAEIFISILYTVLGNIDDLSKAVPKLENAFARLEDVLELSPFLEKLGKVGEALAKFLAHAAEFGVDAAITVLRPFAGMIERDIPDFFPKILNTFVPPDSSKEGVEKDEPQSFRDYGWHGLPMDNQADDELLPTEFTEIWVPLSRTQQAMQLLHDYFTEPDDAREAYRRTGLYAWEFYSAMPTKLWMSPSHSSGDDDDPWKHGVFRIDPYWFAENSEDPEVTFWPRFWNLLRDAGVPFRLHWGKYWPATSPDDRGWVDYFRSQYPRWDDFLRLRAERDPNNIFLTSYWRDRLGLWDEPEPRPQP
jgi:hypothetical protein